MANRDVVNYLKQQYEAEPTIKNKMNYAYELGNSKNDSDIIEAINLLIELQEEGYELNYKIGALYRKLGNIENALEFF